LPAGGVYSAHLDDLEAGVRVVSEGVQPASDLPFVSDLAAVRRLSHRELNGCLNDLGLVWLKDERRADWYSLLYGLVVHLRHLSAVLALDLTRF
jgi:hypothetical protein